MLMFASESCQLVTCFLFLDDRPARDLDGTSVDLKDDDTVDWRKVTFS